MTPVETEALGARLAAVRDRISRAAARAARDPARIRLVAVSKTFPADHVLAAARAGQLDFGENRVQEALEKQDELAKLDPAIAARVHWHLVGHLQSNKARKAASRFDLVHSIDSADLIAKIEEGCRAANRRIDGLVQVDLALEPTKHGAREEELQNIFERATAAPHIRIAGLMLLPPAVDDPEEARPYFRALRGVRERLTEAGVRESMLAELSMGMSHDYEVAVEEGATLVRVGSAIFGNRVAGATAAPPTGR